MSRATWCSALAQAPKPLKPGRQEKGVTDEVNLQHNTPAIESCDLDIELLARPLSSMSEAEALAELERVRAAELATVFVATEARRQPFTPAKLHALLLRVGTVATPKPKRPRGRPVKGAVHIAGGHPLRLVHLAKQVAELYPGLMQSELEAGRRMFGEALSSQRVAQMNAPRMLKSAERIGKGFKALYNRLQERPTAVAIAEHLHIHPQSVRAAIRKKRKENIKLGI